MATEPTTCVGGDGVPQPPMHPPSHTGKGGRWPPFSLVGAASGRLHLGRSLTALAEGYVVVVGGTKQHGGKGGKGLFSFYFDGFKLLVLPFFQPRLLQAPCISVHLHSS